jgi:hypothetical protein
VVVNVAGHGRPRCSPAVTTQDELVHQDLPCSATVDYVYGRTDRLGLPLMQSITKSGGAGTVRSGDHQR